MATKQGKTDFLTIRVPKEIRDKIAWAIDELEKSGKKKISQSDFYIEATLTVIKRLEKGKAVILPASFKQMPTADRKMISIRVPPDLIPRINAFVPRLFHTTTKFVLWAATVRTYELRAALAKQKKSKPSK